jgi:hypothetical protein
MAELDPFHIPSLGGATAWLNFKPIGPAELRDRIALVSFWTPFTFG